MPSRKKDTPKPPKPTSKTELRSLKRKRELDDLAALQETISSIDLKDPNHIPATTFDDLPLSTTLRAGLRASHFETLTDIQARAIPLALKGHDILGAAKTGSGKTLAFLIPVLEKLRHARWTTQDGLGALIMSPTRELAVQTFEVLRKIGRTAEFSAGLVIGGKSLEEEAAHIPKMNILVCTPGRMLQHLDQSAGLDVNNLMILVLDEADQIMNLGFKDAVDALVEHLPSTRQTLLFSATQSKRVSDLARLSLKEPEYVAVHEDAAAATPAALQQFYIVTPLPEKLDTLFGFIKSNLKSKMIVFLTSGKQVRFVYEAFRQMQPGIPLLHLHGKQRQSARLEIMSKFTAAKSACLFATDVVARGVDFPAVDWVVQVDCPESADTYIHRVGRTARYGSKGRAVLFLDPSEEAGMVARLEAKKVPIKMNQVKEAKKKSITNELQGMSWKQHDIKYLAQKAFVTYVRSVHLQKDKEIFDLKKLDTDGYAASLGLAGTPQIKILAGSNNKEKNAPRLQLSSDSEEEEAPKKDVVRTQAQRMLERTNQDVFSGHYKKLLGDEGDGADDGEADFFPTKRLMAEDDLDAAADTAPVNATRVVDFGGDQKLIIDSKRREKLLTSKKKLLKFKGSGQKLLFDDDGNAHPLYELEDEEDFKAQGPAEELRQQFVTEQSDRVKEGDVEDKKLMKEKRKAKREKRKAAERGETVSGAGPQLAGEDDGKDEDPLALLRSLPMGEGSEDDGDSEDADERPKKRSRRRDSDESDGDERLQRRRVVRFAGDDGEPETLDDLEAIAAGLLDD